MNTKPFVQMARYAFVAAAALAWVVSVHSASAQSYSFNALGYADASWGVGSNLVANPFNADPNTISNVLRGLPEGSYFIPWNPVKQEYGPTNFYSQANGWTDPGASLGTLDSGFLCLPASAQMSFVGEVPIGDGCLSFPRGISISTVMPEQACVLECEFSPCPPPMPDGTVIQKWNAASQQWDSALFYIPNVGWTDGVGLVTPRIASTESFQIYTPVAFRARTSKAAGRLSALTPVRWGFPTWARGGTGLDLQIPVNNTNGPGMSSTNWSLVRSTNLGSPIWEVVQTGATATGTVTSLTVPTGTNDAAFYRLLPFLPSSYPHMLNGRRSGTRFSFEFYAPEAGNYQVQRTTNSTPERTSQWQTIQTVAATAGTVVVVTDTNATAAAGYYRMSY